MEGLLRKGLGITGVQSFFQICQSVAKNSQAFLVASVTLFLIMRPETIFLWKKNVRNVKKYLLVSVNREGVGVRMFSFQVRH